MMQVRTLFRGKMRQLSPVRRACGWVFLAVLATTMCYAVNPQHDDGIVGMTRKNGYGCACHSLNATPSVLVWVSGPAIVRAGSTNLYSLTMVGGPAVSGGFNIAAGTGTLFANSSDEKAISGELTHAMPKLFTADTVRWSFSYRAPEAQGHDTIYAVAQSVNGNGLPDNGDQWNFADNFTVTVASSEHPVPSLTEWGIVLLVLGFVLIVQRLLAIRRRPA